MKSNVLSRKGPITQVLEEEGLSREDQSQTTGQVVPSQGQKDRAQGQGRITAIRRPVGKEAQGAVCGYLGYSADRGNVKE